MSNLHRPAYDNACEAREKADASKDEPRDLTWYLVEVRRHHLPKASTTNGRLHHPQQYQVGCNISAGGKEIEDHAHGSHRLAGGDYDTADSHGIPYPLRVMSVDMVAS